MKNNKGNRKKYIIIVAMSLMISVLAGIMAISKIPNHLENMAEVCKKYGNVVLASSLDFDEYLYLPLTNECY